MLYARHHCNRLKLVTPKLVSLGAPAGCRCNEHDLFGFAVGLHHCFEADNPVKAKVTLPMLFTAMQVARPTLSI